MEIAEQPKAVQVRRDYTRDCPEIAPEIAEQPKAVQVRKGIAYDGR